MPTLEQFIGDLDNYMGSDDDMLMGAPRRRRPQAVTNRRRAAASLLSSPAPGVPQAGARIEPLGFPTVTFNNTSGVLLTSTARPQKPFKGSRLGVTVARTGATATGLVTVARLTIGARDVFVNNQPIPAELFAPNAFGIELNMDEAGPGIDIAVQFGVSAAPGAGDSIVVGVCIIGLTWA